MNFDRLLSHWQNAVRFDWSRLGTATSAGLTIFIAAAAVYVAYQQHVTNKRQLRLALFEKRLAVYEWLMRLRSNLLRDANVDLNQLSHFLRETREHQFLFGKDVADYIDEIYHQAVTVWGARQPASSSEPATATNVLEWFGDQRDVAREKFLKYMDFTKPCFSGSHENQQRCRLQLRTVGDFLCCRLCRLCGSGR